MQNEKQILVNQVIAPESKGPVEIDASLLQFVGGAAPKTGWTEPELVVNLSSSSDAPKTGW